MANEIIVSVQGQYLESGGFTSSAACIVGHWAGDPTNGALRFANVQINKNQSLDAAYLVYKYADVGDAGNWKFNVYGIDEDNTATFGNPFGRPRTSASKSYDEGAPTSGGTKTIDIKSILEEITSRSGWSSGNAIGITLLDNGSANNVFAQASLSNSFIAYRTDSVNLKPTPKSIAAPTFPATSDYGIRISKPGVDVRTATESQLFFTTRKKEFKVIDEAEITTSSTSYNVAHNLSYAPAAMVYAASGGKRVKLNRIFSPNYVDPIGGVQGKFGCNQTNLNIATSNGIQVYYYIFIDELE